MMGRKNKQKIDAKNDRDNIGISNHPEDAANEGEETTKDVQDADHKVEHVHCVCFLREKKNPKKKRKGNSLTKNKKRGASEKTKTKKKHERTHQYLGRAMKRPL